MEIKQKPTWTISRIRATARLFGHKITSVGGIKITDEQGNSYIYKQSLLNYNIGEPVVDWLEDKSGNITHSPFSIHTLNLPWKLKFEAEGKIIIDEDLDESQYKITKYETPIEEETDVIE